MPAAETRATVTAHSIDLIDKDDAGSILFALLEQVAYPRSADTHKHFHEIRTGNREKRNVRLAGNCARQQGFACARRPHQQDALGNAAAQRLELLRLAKELNDLLELFLGLVHTGHILKGDLFLLHRKQPRPALAERQRLVPARLHLPQHKEPQRADNQQRP